jgi:hypothetical protein
MGDQSISLQQPGRTTCVASCSRKILQLAALQNVFAQQKAAARGAPGPAEGSPILEQSTAGSTAGSAAEELKAA